MGSGGTTALLPPGKFCNLPNSTLITGADTQSRTGDLTLTKGALYQLSHISTLIPITACLIANFTNLMPGSSLLSHGETPHYHRRYGVSLLSSAWGQVGPPRCCRQANSVSFIPLTLSQACTTNQSWNITLKNLGLHRVNLKHLWCCKVKPLGSLVLVSSMHRCTYTPSLSTS
jgi:hypothetical protein